MKIGNLFSKKELAKLPIIFNFFTKKQINTQNQLFPEKRKLVKIDFYQTEEYKTHKFYKPISKML